MPKPLRAFLALSISAYHVPDYSGVITDVCSGPSNPSGRRVCRVWKVLVTCGPTAVYGRHSSTFDSLHPNWISYPFATYSCRRENHVGINDDEKRNKIKVILNNDSN